MYKTWQSDYQICLKHLTKAIFHRCIFFLLYCGKGTIITARKPFINRSPTKFSCSVNKSAWRSKPWLEETTERLWIRFIDFEACVWSRKVLFVESLKYFVRMFWDFMTEWLIFNLLSLSFFVRGVLLISIRTLIPWLTFVKVRQWLLQA